MTDTLTLRLLGTPIIELNGQPLTGLPSRAAEALLIYLACTGRTHARDVTAELLWNDRDQKQAMANLRSILSSLRRKLKPFLDITRQTVAMDAESDYWLDVAVFEAQIRDLDAVLHHTAAPLAPETVSRLEEALALYRGDFLEGFYLRSGRGFEEWALLQRERLRRLAHTALFRLVRHHLEAGNYAAGIRHAERLLAIDPLDERGRRAAMWLLARNGQRNAALQQYETLHRLLAKELDVTPTAETTALYERIRSAQDRPRHNLPPQSTPFVGRERELQALAGELATPGCRLLTILGPGGVGKTRLLLELGRRTAKHRPGRYLHGVRYVPLAHLGTARFLPAAIADALNLTLSGGDPAADLLDYLREKELLLLLDNFEHLFDDGTDDDGADLVAAILAEAPLVTVVTTSRERLQMQEEWVFDLDGLHTPPPAWEETDATTLAETASTFPAVALFLQNARRVSRRFRPTAGDLRAIAAVCRRLDGLPLGIELAATWIRQFPCTAILGQIEDDLDFLTTPIRNVPERHRSLRAVFNHSWHLLDEAEQAAVTALTVFEGAFTVRAAKQVAGATAPLLAALVDKSFLRRVQTKTDARYEMHDLLRQYAGEHLARDPERKEAVTDAHAAYFAHFLHARTEALKGAGQQRAYREIGAVVDEIRAAWEWNLEQGRFDNVARALEALFYFYWARGWLHEGATVAERTAGAVATLAPANRLLLAQAQMLQGEFYGWLGRYEDARPLLQGAIDTFRELDARPGLVFALISLGRIHYWQGTYPQALAIFRESVALSRQLDDDHLHALALNSLATTVAEAEADYDRSWTLYEESLAASRQIGDRFGTARALVNMGAIAQERAQYDEARRLYEESLAIYREIAYGHGIAAALNYLGQVATLTGDYDRARTLIRESHDLNREQGNRRAVVNSLKQLGNVARAAGERREAKRRYDEALRLTQQMGPDQVTLAVLLEVAALLAPAGDEERALTLLAFVLAQPEAGQELHDAAQALFAEASDGVASTCVEQCRQQGAALSLNGAIERVLRG